MYSHETVTSFLRRVRKRLDQELDVSTNFWSPAEMLEYLNEGRRELWAKVRETHQNWFVRDMASRDPVVSIGGRKYDPAALKLASPRDKLLLPPDFHELILFEALTNQVDSQPLGPAVPAVVLEYAGMPQHTFRQGVFDTVTTGVRRYRYDIVFSPDGPYIFVAPTISVEDITDTKLVYVAMPPALQSDGTFEGTGFTELMVDALLYYVCRAAVAKEGIKANVDTFAALYKDKLVTAVGASSPKQTRDETTVEGFLEEELL